MFTEIVGPLVPYVCGPLTELPPEEQEGVKQFYTDIADICEAIRGHRAFVPHEHYDPVKNANFTPPQVDAAERHQVCDLTSLLIIVAIAPSWGGGIEDEMARTNDVPAVLLADAKKLANGKISRLLRGNAAIMKIIAYEDEADALHQLRNILRESK